MSQNLKSACVAASRDANNNTVCAGAAPRGSHHPAPPNPYQQVTAKVLFGSVTAINDLKLREKAEREVRRTH